MLKLYRWIIPCLLACAALSSWGEVVEWQDGDVVDVGCQGAGDNNLNDDGTPMCFLGSGVIHGTYTPEANNPSSWAIWRNYLITNGTVVVDATDVRARIKDGYPSFQRGIILGETGALVISNATRVGMGELTAGKYPIVDVRNLSFVTPGNITLHSCTVKGFPSSGFSSIVFKSDATVAVAAPDFLAAYGTDFSTTTLTKLYVFDDAFFPEGSAVSVGPKCELHLAAYEIDPVKGDFRNTTVNHTEKPWTAAYGAYPASAHAISFANKLVLESTCACAFSGALTGTTAASTVSLSGGLEHTFASLAGTLRFDTYSSGLVATGTVASVAPGTRLFAARGKVVLNLPENNAARPIELTDGTLFVFPDAKGAYDFRNIDAPALTAHVAVSGASYPEPSRFGRMKVAVDADATLDVAVDALTTPAFVGGEGTIRLTESVCNRALLWIDPSDDATFYKLGTAIPDYIRAKVAAVNLTTQVSGNDLVEAIADKRSLQTELFLRHSRHYDYVDDKGYIEDLPGVFPMRVKNGPNGLAYLSNGTQGTARRIQTYTGTMDLTSTTAPTAKTLTGTKFVTMVFGSQNGGGLALVGLGDGALRRSGATKNDPIAQASLFSGRAWVDGEMVNPTTTGLSGGWQIISLDITGHNVNAFGWIKAYNASEIGGQNYGEILVFSEALTDAARVRVERYLARKWGLEAQYRGVAAPTDEPGRAFLYGTNGTVAVDGHVRLSGTYSGSIAVAADATLDVTGAYAPEIPSEGRIGWYDPDGEGALTCNTEDDAATITALWPQGCTMETTPVGDLFFYGISSRKPFATRRAGGFGRMRTWIDFDHPASHKVGSSDGNTLRFKAWSGNIGDSSYSGGGSDRNLSVRTVVFVNDSFRGGGDPLRKSVSDGGDWGSRGSCTPAKVIWNGAGTKVTAGTTRLNGVQVNGAATGYTGEAEVLSVVTTNSVVLGNFGAYGNSEGKSGYAEMMGESLMYSTALSTAQVKTIEDYLLFKWTGIAPEGYGDFTEATVSGTGMVRAEKWSDLPRFDAAFAGTVSVTNEAALTLTMSVDATSAPGAVTGAFRLPAATLAGISAATINVQVTGDTLGNYPLVELASVASPIAWTVNVSGISPSKAKAAVAREGASVVLKLQMSGTMVIVR